MTNFSNQRVLGRSGLLVGALGFGSSYGAPAAAYEAAFERGCNYFYWGSYRRDGMGAAIRNISPKSREKLVVVLQSYARHRPLLEWSVTRGLRQLKLEYADVLLLGWHNEEPKKELIDRALELKERGIVRKIAISGHNRPLFQKLMKDAHYDIIMVRYNAAHRGAEREVFPHLSELQTRPGVVTYTTTRWGYLINPKYTPPGVKTPTAVDCYRFALTNSFVDVCLSGPASEDEMKANLKALQLGPLSPEEMSWIKSVGDHVHKMTSQKMFTNPFMQRQV